MKTIITSLLILLTTQVVSAQGMYEQKMGEAMNNYANVSSIADYQQSAAEFELIASVETSEWLPLYYQAQCYILMSFNDNEANEAAKDAYLDNAEVALNKMINLAPNESEVYALQALYYTAKLVINPMTRGQKYGALTQTAIQKSLAIDPENQRAKQLNLSNKIGTAQFFEQDITVYCEDVNALLAVWDDYPDRGSFYPKWGKNQVIALSKQCEEAQSEPAEEAPTNAAATSTKSELVITIKKLKSNEGHVLLELVDENEKTVTQTMGVIKDNTCTIVINDLATGNYAVRFFHDANENKTMDTSKRGIPTESYGFSNNARGFMSAPKFKKTLFSFEQNKSITLKAR